MSWLKQKWMVPTYFEYFFSYLLILCVFIAGSWFIVRKQMTDTYFDQRVDSARVQLDYVAGEIKDSLLFLSQLDSNLITNEVLQKYNYQQGNTYKDAALKELKREDASSLIINNIVYMSWNLMVPLSTQAVVEWKDDAFLCSKTISYDNSYKIMLKPLSYLGQNEPCLINFSDEKGQYVVYFPSLASKSNFVFFYTLDINEIQSQMKTIVSDEIESVALLDNAGKIVRGENSLSLVPYLDGKVLYSGKYEQKDGNYLCVSDEIMSGYYLVALIDKASLEHQIMVAFTRSYLAFMLLGIVGFLMVFVGMKFTYIPLLELARRIMPESFEGRFRLQQLEDSFSEAYRKNQELNSKLDNYRFYVQKALLDSLIMAEPDVQRMESAIEKLLDETMEKQIFIVSLSFGAEALPENKLKEMIERLIGKEDSCITLESGKDYVVYLINYIGKEPDKAERLNTLLWQYYESYGCLSAISRSSESPMDIPALYENVRDAADSWPQIPVVDGALLPSKDDLFAYPSDKLSVLAQSLTDNDFGKAKDITRELFERLHKVSRKKIRLQEYYVQNILMSMLIHITNAMNRSNIEFDTYSDSYYETLYLIRSHSYEEKAEEIALNIKKMLNLYEKISTQKMIFSKPFQRAMEEGYCQPDFSVAVLAERFGVSVSYMSYQFKKEMNITFSEYLWMLRLQKAKELLVMTDMPVEEVAIAVGYYSRTSFMKRFKVDTGLTPTQYRMQGKG